jgi:hypothetical protein
MALGDFLRRRFFLAAAQSPIYTRRQLQIFTFRSIP